MSFLQEKIQFPRVNLRAIVHRFDHPFFVMLQHWIDPRDPIVRRELARSIPMPTLTGMGIDSKITRFLVRFVSEWSNALGCLLMPLFFLGPFIPWLWRIPTIFSTGPLISREIEKRTWMTLRSTPASTREIVRAIHAGGTYRVAFIWAYVTSIRGAIVGLLAMIMFILAWSPGRDRLKLDWIEWVAYLGGAIYFVIEPAFDMAVDGMIGMLGSTFGRTQLIGMLYGAVLRLAIWGVQLMSLIFIMPLANASLEIRLADNVPALVLLGPAYALMLDFSPEATLVMLVVVTGFRLVWLTILDALVTWRAEVVQE